MAPTGVGVVVRGVGDSPTIKNRDSPRRHGGTEKATTNEPFDVENNTLRSDHPVAEPWLFSHHVIHSHPVKHENRAS